MVVIVVVVVVVVVVVGGVVGGVVVVVGGVGFFLKRSFKRGMPTFIIAAPTFTSPPRSLKSHYTSFE